MVSRRELNSHKYPLTKQQKRNFAKLYVAINKLRKAYNKPMIVTSGVRSIDDQKRINPKAMKSAHVQAGAVDFFDPYGELDRWCLDNIPLLKSLGLYLEDPTFTPRWCHLQIIPTRSGNIVFIP
jgi:hypothetical protein